MRGEKELTEYALREYVGMLCRRLECGPLKVFSANCLYGIQAVSAAIKSGAVSYDPGSDTVSLGGEPGS